MSSIHPTALIEEGAKLSEGVEIGPYCRVGRFCELGPGVRLSSHVVLQGAVSLGQHVNISPFACLGMPPQKFPLTTEIYQEEHCGVEVGAHTIIREHVTIHAGTLGDQKKTQVGAHCVLMVGSHIGHDCIVEDHVVITNNTLLGGHVQVGHHTVIGGNTAIHQRVQIGPYSMIGGMSGIKTDVIPFGVVQAKQACLTGLNLIGLKRQGFSTQTIQALREAYQKIFDLQDRPLAERVAYVASTYAHVPEVKELIHFIQVKSARNLCMPEGRLLGVREEVTP